MRGGTHDVAIELPAEVRSARRELEVFLADSRWNGDVDAVLLAVQEALINADRHGGGLRAVRARLVADRLEVDVVDRGEAFAPESYVALAPDALAERGRGLWIMDHLAESFDIAADDQGTTLCLRFTSAPPAPVLVEEVPPVPQLQDLGLDVLTAMGAAALIIDARMIVREAAGALEDLFGMDRQALLERDLRAVTSDIKHRFADPVHYEDTVLRSYAHPQEGVTDAFVLVDGRIVRRHSEPIVRDSRVLGRLSVYLPLLEHRDLATALQEALLPAFPDWDELEVGAIYHPAEASTFVGGDFYDFISLAAGGRCIAVGDVSGRGPAAAAASSRVRAYLRAAIATAGVTGLMPSVEEALARDFGDEDFVSLAVAVQETTEVWTLLVAGHPPPLLLSRGTVVEPPASGPLMGMAIPEAEWARVPFVLERGDVLLLYTDGILDAGRGIDRFGGERLAAALAELRDLSAQGLVEALDERVHAYALQHLADDHVLLAVRRR